MATGWDNITELEMQNLGLPSIVIEFVKAKQIVDRLEDQMSEYFNTTYLSDLDSMSLDQIKMTKEHFRRMPECPSKVWLFRKIILKEDKLNSGD